MTARGKALPDADQRRLILEELDRNLLVEAAAGTGKTTSMVGRMVALLHTGTCAEIRHLAAVTFTRKAAAELRTRFQLELEKAVSSSGGDEKGRLETALRDIDQCFIGTIHSFCGRLLRERPVEAGVDIDFTEIDDDDDRRLRKEAWDDYVVRLLADDPEGALAQLDSVGLSLADLEGSFLRFADFPDVDEWPTGETPNLPDTRKIVRETEAYLQHMDALRPNLPAAWGNDRLIPEYRRLPRIASHHRLDDPVQLAALLARFDRSCTLVQKDWMNGDFSRDEAREEGARWEDFRARVAQPFLSAWRERRYALVMRLLHEARQRYDHLRSARGQLNFQDLLMKAAALLRSSDRVRLYFQRRCRNLLVDEFQDTDPIQAEVMLLLTSSDPHETDWRECRPRPGSLFVVGDPKQSIYRFRRADVVTYNEVKQIIEAGGGMVVELSTNFRSTPTIISWVNGAFAPAFADGALPYSPAYVPLYPDPERKDTVGALAGVRLLQVPPEHSNRAASTDWEADIIARTIRRALDTDAGAKPGDFMILTRTKADLSLYARNLQAYGIPHRVTGGSALNEVPEVRLLSTALNAVIRDDDPVALVAALRSELFGLSDTALYRFKKAGGRFSYREAVPADLPTEDARAFADAFSHLQRCRRWLEELPPLAAIERAITALGLTARAAARDGGDGDAGSLARCVELLRAERSQMWTSSELVEYLGEIAQMAERFDGLSVGPGDRSAVAVMNLHQAKGLEAPVVFLANPRGDSDHPVELHVDRSGEKIRGYMALSRPTAQYQSECLAHPPGWDESEAEERRFLEAENLRLRYVAATRAGRALIVTQLPKRNHTNPWRFFGELLSDELPDPGPQSAPQTPTETLAQHEPEDAMAAISAHLDRAGAPTYATQRAKDYALAALDREPVGPMVGPLEPAGSPPLSAEGEQGTEWGSVIHLLLSAAAEDPEADLRGLARTALEEQDLDPGLADAAVTMVRSVMRSDIWRRASQSGTRLTEVPFVIRRDEGGLPVLVKGAVDLAFREADGWVLVDYKTDAAPEAKLPSLASGYASQLRTYAAAWEQCTGDTVTELAIYFVRAGALVKVSL